MRKIKIFENMKNFNEFNDSWGFAKVIYKDQTKKEVFFKEGGRHSMTSSGQKHYTELIHCTKYTSLYHAIRNKYRKETDGFSIHISEVKRIEVFRR